MDMPSYWTQDQTKQDHLHVFWKSVTANLGNYFTKHHPLHHHIEMWPIYLHIEATPEKSSVGLCSLLAATANLGNYNIISTPKNTGMSLPNHNPLIDKTQKTG